MRRTIYILAALSLAIVTLASCQKKFVTAIDLAVDYSDEAGGLVLTKSVADTCYIHITSNTAWKASLSFPSADDLWCSLGQSAGEGSAWIELASKANESGNERTAVLRVESASKNVEFTITQPK